MSPKRIRKRSSTVRNTKKSLNQNGNKLTTKGCTRLAPKLHPHLSQANIMPSHEARLEDAADGDEPYEILPCKVSLDKEEIHQYLRKYNLTFEELCVRSGISQGALTAQVKQEIPFQDPSLENEAFSVKHITIKSEPDEPVEIKTEAVGNYVAHSNSENSTVIDTNSPSVGIPIVTETVSFVNITIPPPADMVQISSPCSRGASQRPPTPKFDFARSIKVEPYTSDFEEDYFDPALACFERIPSSPSLQTSPHLIDEPKYSVSDEDPIVDFGCSEKINMPAVGSTSNQSEKSNLKFVFKKQKYQKEQYAMVEVPQASGSQPEKATPPAQGGTIQSDLLDSDEDVGHYVLDLDDDENDVQQAVSNEPVGKDGATQTQQTAASDKTPSVYHCVPCAEKFASSNQLKDHVLNLHRECLSTTTAVSMEKKGIAMVKYVTGVCFFFECPYCYCLIEDILLTTKHIAKSHPNSLAGGGRVSCVKVPVKTMSIGLKIPSTGQFHCGYCNRNFILFKKLTDHMREHGVFECPKCLCFFNNVSCPVCPKLKRFFKPPIVHNLISFGSTSNQQNNLTGNDELLHSMGAFSVKSSTFANDLRTVLGIRPELEGSIPDCNTMWTTDLVAKELKNAPSQDREIVVTLPKDQAGVVDEQEDGAYCLDSSDSDDSLDVETANDAYTLATFKNLLLSRDKNLHGDIIDLEKIRSKPAARDSDTWSNITFRRPVGNIKVTVPQNGQQGKGKVKVYNAVKMSSQSGEKDKKPQSISETGATTSKHDKHRENFFQNWVSKILPQGFFSTIKPLNSNDRDLLADIKERMKWRTVKSSMVYFPCLFCERITDDPDILVGHMTIHHIYCLQCRNIFQSHEHFMDHCELKFYKCFNIGCSQTFCTDDQFVNHKTLVHDEDDVNFNKNQKIYEFEVRYVEDSIPCRYCFEYFDNSDILERHLLLEHSVSKCADCISYFNIYSHCIVCLQVASRKKKNP